MKLYVGSQLFINHLYQSKFYKKIDLFLLPDHSTNHVHFHFKIMDKQPKFFSLTNNFDRQGDALLEFKTGYRNFLGYHDTLGFEFEKMLIRKGGMNWMLNWSYDQLNGNNIGISFRQSHRYLNQMLDEKVKEFTLKYQTTNQTEFTISKAYRSNKINTLSQDSTIQNLLFQKYFLNHSDFNPSNALLLGYNTNIYSNIEESYKENVPQGSNMYFQSQIGLPYFSQKPFLRCQFSHEYHYPLYKYKHRLRNLKNSSFQFNFNYGFAMANHLMVNDAFQFLSYRGFSDISNIQTIPTSNFNSKHFKMNVYNIEQLQKQNIKLFYYATLFTQSTDSVENNKNLKNLNLASNLSQLKSNIRGSYGFGLAMPISQQFYIEALLNMGVWRQKRFDKTHILQLRLAIND